MPDGAHHPSVERWRPIAEKYFRASDVDYALMLMWAESRGDPSSFNDQRGTVGLMSMPVYLWPQRIKAARAYWGARGMDVPLNVWDPEAQIAVASWIVNHQTTDPTQSSWSAWTSSSKYYPPGSWQPGVTYWNGTEYVNTAVKPQGYAPRGDGQAAGNPGGMMEASTSLGGGFSWVLPVPGAPEPGPGSLFGDSRTGHTHAGIDLAGEMGQPILAAQSGVVVYAGMLNESAGRAVAIRHPNGWTTHYFHCDSELVSVGDQVRAGQPIATIGATGNANGPHLHFETRYNGTSVDPLTLKMTNAVEGADIYTAEQRQGVASASRSVTGSYFGSGLTQPD